MLFPPEVVVVEATPEMYEGPLLPEEAPAVVKAVKKRRREFTAGRLAARAALQALGVPPVALPQEEDRTPRWPADVVGSITHTMGRCAAAVAKKGPLIGVGFDIEQALPLKPGMLRHIATPDEQEQLARLPAGVDWGKVTFSAKEAFYKCYYPLARTFLGFHDVELEIDPEAGTFVGAIINPDKPSFDGRRSMQGKLHIDDRYVTAAVALRGD